MRVRLKGLNRITKRLANGKTYTYYYAWKGGPRLEGKPGSPEFIASYNRAVESVKRTSEGTVRFIIDAYQKSSEFERLSPRTKIDYRRFFWIIEAEFGEFPLAAYEDRRTRGEFLAWRDRLAIKSRRQADYAFTVFARINAWAFNRGMIPINPCERAGRLYRAIRQASVWSDADEAAFYEKAPAHLHLALTLALWTGQRQGDLLKLTWDVCEGEVIRLRQGKTKAPVAFLSVLHCDLHWKKKKRASKHCLLNSLVLSLSCPPKQAQPGRKMAFKNHGAEAALQRVSQGSHSMTFAAQR